MIEISEVQTITHPVREKHQWRVEDYDLGLSYGAVAAWKQQTEDMFSKVAEFNSRNGR